MPSEASQEWHAHPYPNCAFCPYNALESLQKAAEALKHRKYGVCYLENGTSGLRKKDWGSQQLSQQPGQVFLSSSRRKMAMVNWAKQDSWNIGQQELNNQILIT